MQDDFRKIQMDYYNDRTIFNSQDIQNCMRKCMPVQLHEWVQVGVFDSFRLYKCYD